MRRRRSCGLDAVEAGLEGGQLGSLRRWALVTGSEGTMSLIAPLSASLEAYRAEAAPVRQIAEIAGEEIAQPRAVPAEEFGMKHEDGFERQRRGGSEYHGEATGGGGAPGKRAPSDRHAPADPITTIVRNVEAVEAGLRAVAARHLPAMKAATAGRDMGGARNAAGTLSGALERIERQLASMKRWAMVSGSEGALSLIAPLSASLEAYRAEAAPVLALAPPPAPVMPVAAAFDPLSTEWDAPIAADEAHRASWASKLDAADAAAPANVIDASARFGAEPVQRRARGPVDPAQVQAHAAAGVAGTGGALPHGDAIQASFGPHDVGGIRAHVGGAAASASEAIGAEAYATGNDVAFASSPSLFVAAHEAAHVVQQRAGVSLLGGVGEAGDRYEQHADAVAEKVVRSESAAELLGEVGGASAGCAVQKFDPAGIAESVIEMQQERAIEKAAEADRRAAIEKEPEQDKRRREWLINNIADQSAYVIGLQKTGVTNATKRLGDSPSKKAASLSLVDLAASAAIAGVAGFVSTTIAQHLVGETSSREAKALVDMFKDGIKTALKAGVAQSRSIGSGPLLEEFAESQVFKVERAMSQLTAELWTTRAEQLYFLELTDLEGMSTRATQMAQLEDITNEQERVTANEWINFVARAHHGAGTWDAEDGPAPIPTGSSLSAHGKESEEMAARSNVAADGSAEDLVHDESQRKMQDAHYGLLEVSLCVHRSDDGRTDFWLYEHTGYGMRMDNVNAYAKEQLMKSGTFAAARVNKIIRLYTDFELNPPKPWHAILVTADGWIRAESFHNVVSTETSLAAVRYADALPLTHLK